MMKLFLSQNIEFLAKSLSEEISAENSNFLKKKWILVPNASIKQWLSIQLARLNDRKIFAGWKICSIEEAIYPDESLIPTSLELFCSIYKALKAASAPDLANFLNEGTKRKKELATHLASLFRTYSLFEKSFLERQENWQISLYKKIFSKDVFQSPSQILPEADIKIAQEKIHCFGFDFLPPIYWEFLAKSKDLNVYLFSPCVHFWEDLCSKWERRNLLTFLEKKGVPLIRRDELESYLLDAPILLSNWGKLGRETLKSLDQFSFEIEEVYAPPSLDNSLLQAVQNEILFFEKTPIPSADLSIRVFLTGSSKFNEIENLRNEILQLASTESISFSEIAIFAPDIQPYVPLIQYFFSDPSAPIPYRFSKVEIGGGSSFYQGLQKLIGLIKNKWRHDDMIELLETPSFYRRQKWEKEKIEQFKKWSECFLRGSLDWKASLQNAVKRLVTLFPEPRGVEISFGDADLLEEFLLILDSLNADLIPLQTAEFTLGDWALRWSEIVGKYLSYDSEDERDTSAFSSFNKTIKEFREADLRLGPDTYSFDAIESFLNQPFYGPIHASHLHAVRIGSIETGTVFPAKAIFLIGMDEESFPRRKIESSLNLLKEAPIYIPENRDMDRYLFLQLIFAAQTHLRISYGHISEEDGKPKGPSLLVQELLNFLGAEKSAAITTARLFSLKETKIPSRFSIKSPEPFVFEQERVVQLSDLSLFARHPWKFYLQKQIGIYLDSQLEDNFSLKKESILRSAMKWPLEKILSNRSDFPKGIFGEALRLDLEEKIKDRKKQIDESCGRLFSLSFLQTVREKRWVSDRMEVPPLKVEMGDGSVVLILGEIPFVSEKAVLHFGQDKLPSLIKSWPECLAASLVLGTSEIFFLKSGKFKTIRNPEKALRDYLEYFFRCREIFSPLLPDWADSFLRKGMSAFDFSTEYEDPIIDWVLPRLEKPSVESLFSEWSWLKDSFGELVDLYPSRIKKEAYETV